MKADKQTFNEIKRLADSAFPSAKKVDIQEYYENDVECFKVVVDGETTYDGPFSEIKIKLEDKIDISNLQSKIQALISEGKSDKEIAKILSEETNWQTIASQKGVEIADKYRSLIAEGIFSAAKEISNTDESLDVNNIEVVVGQTVLKEIVYELETLYGKIESKVKVEKEN